MENAKKRKIAKRYMYYCVACHHLSFQESYCEECGQENLIQTPKRYGLTNLACISMSVMDFEAMKQEFIQEADRQIG